MILKRGKSYQVAFHVNVHFPRPIFVFTTHKYPCCERSVSRMDCLIIPETDVFARNKIRSVFIFFIAIKSHWCALGFTTLSYYPHLYYCDYVSVLFSRIFLGHQENWFFHKDYFVERKRSWKSFSNVSLRLSEEAAKRVISLTKGKKRIAQETVNQRHEKFK